MAYDRRILHLAQQRYDDDRRHRRERLQQRRETLYLQHPRLRQIEQELRSTMSRLLADAIRFGEDPRPMVYALRDENLRLQEERRAILTSLHLPANALDDRPLCPLCGDTGYRDGKVCQCLRTYYTEEQNKELSSMLDLGRQSFDTFSMDWYSETPDPAFGVSPRQNMETVYEVCADYAAHFSRRSGNLLLYGASGLGKTFLSACIAREVSAGGFSVVYDTAGQIFSKFENQKFSRDADDAGIYVDRVLACDLLILDDLGTEMTTSFVVSALYQMVNTRLLQEKCTILNTNLPPSELERRYSPQIASRIEGYYQILPFFGEDIRKLRRERKP